MTSLVNIATIVEVHKLEQGRCFFIPIITEIVIFSIYN